MVALSGPGHYISESHHKSVVSALLKLSDSYPELQFVFKLHPKDESSYYLEAARHLDMVCPPIMDKDSIPHHLSIFDWLAGADVLITGGSSVANEALLCGVPVITVDFEAALNSHPFI